MQIELMKDYLELKEKKAALKSQLDEVNSEMANLADQITDTMANEGVQSVNVDNRTIYLRKRIWATTLHREKVVKYFERQGMRGMVSVNAQILSSWIRERLESGKKIPKALQDAIEIKDKVELGVRK